MREAINAVQESGIIRESSANIPVEPTPMEKEYTPPPQEALKEYEVQITFLSIGCVIRVGCKSIPFQSVEEAMNEFNRYVKDPWNVRAEWNKKLA